LARLTLQNVLTAVSVPLSRLDGELVRYYNRLVSYSHQAYKRLVLFPTWVLLDLLSAGHGEQPWI